MDSVECSYSIRGSGPAIFFVHGVGARKTSWSEVCEHLIKDFTCICYDLRGHGESPKGDLPYSLDCLVSDLEALRARLKIQKIHIVGHSLGGMIGPAYALSFPQNTLSVSILSSAAFRTLDDKKKVKAVLKSMKTKGISPILATLTDRWFTDDFIKNRSADVQLRLQQVIDTDPDVFLEVFRIYSETEMSSWLSKINHPCFILTGENDGGCSPRLNKLIAASLPDSELSILKGYKHSLLIEAPSTVGQKVHRFLTRKNF
ncbi:alpha/beta hydrolase [Candidatus Thioglobus sp.]|nr:alpha/beta hydrolase [Candidatus Thioglobus sp.]